MCLCMSFQRKVLILEDSSVWVVSNFNPLFFIAKFLTPLQVLFLCVFTLMAKAMRKALTKNLHESCITCLQMIPSTDTEFFV